MSEVIIDGVNVAECEFFKENRGFNCFKKKGCTENSNCYFKQLQRAKAENEILHITIEKLKGDLCIAEDSLRDYQEHYNKLEAENEKLKKAIKLYAEINENDTAYNAVLLKENKELKMKNNELLVRLSEKYGVFN